MATRTFDDILSKADKFAAQHLGGECEILARHVVNLENRLEDPDLTAAQQRLIAIQLRAIVREMQAMQCTVPQVE